MENEKQNHSEKMCDQGLDWRPYTKKLKRPAKMAYPTYLYVKIDCIRKRKNYRIKKLESCVILYSSSSQFCCAKSTFMIRISFYHCIVIASPEVIIYNDK